MNGQPVRPSRHWYWLAAGPGAVAVVLILLAIVGFVSLTQQVSSFPRVQVPGQGTLTFSGTGQYLVYFEGPGFGTSTPSSSGSVPLLLQNQATGQRVQIKNLQNQADYYNLGGHSGTAVGSFTIVTPGTYTLKAGQPTSPALKDIAVGRSFAGSIIASVIEIIIGVVALIGGAVAAVVVAVRRSMYRRRLQFGPPFMQPAMPYPGGPAMPYPGGAPMPYPGGPPMPYPGGPAMPYPGGPAMPSQGEPGYPPPPGTQQPPDGPDPKPAAPPKPGGDTGGT